MKKTKKLLAVLIALAMIIGLFAMTSTTPTSAAADFYFDFAAAGASGWNRVPDKMVNQGVTANFKDWVNHYDLSLSYTGGAISANGVGGATYPNNTVGGVANGTWTFELPAGVVMKSIELTDSAEPSATISLSSSVAGNNTKTGSAGSVRGNTGWTNANPSAASTVTIVISNLPATQNNWIGIYSVWFGDASAIETGTNTNVPTATQEPTVGPTGPVGEFVFDFIAAGASGWNRVPDKMVDKGITANFKDWVNHYDLMFQYEGGAIAANGVGGATYPNGTVGGVANGTWTFELPAGVVMKSIGLTDSAEPSATISLSSSVAGNNTKTGSAGSVGGDTGWTVKSDAPSTVTLTISNLPPSQNNWIGIYSVWFLGDEPVPTTKAPTTTVDPTTTVETTSDPATTTEEPGGLKGDINGDKKVNAMDLLLIKQHILDVPGKKIDEGTPAFLAADMNDDGKINGMDLLLLKKIILG